MFKPVTSQIDFPTLEKQILEWWYSAGIVDKYLHRNDSSASKFSFLDGPITANNPMGVHHAWGRTFKDLFQKFHTLLGDAGRYQNGFDCQGLWVEVEVEKELGFKSKKDIEVYGVDKFVEKCKERVLKYSQIQTDQSKRLGYFMDWNNSYFTMSDENNYEIWNFIKVCWERGWLYKGHDSVPWCPRCETAISQHEMLTEDYKQATHESVYLKLQLIDSPESLLIWTTTPWTIPANIAVAVDGAADYALVEGMWVMKNAVERLFGKDAVISKVVKGSSLEGLKYSSPFDYLPSVKKVSDHPLFHSVVLTDNQIMPITAEDGTGLVHTAVSAGQEDFQLGKKLGLPLIPVIADNADYLPTMGDLSGKNAKKHPELIIDFLKEKNAVLKTEQYTHRYPACWRCKTELVWKIADEWYISMDKADPSDPSGKTLREQMIDVAKKINWIPEFGLDREIDWLNNMHDWLISKKNRYWGLALPIYTNAKGDYFEVVGSKDELKSRATSGWSEFDGHSPHKPWIDAVSITGKNGETLTRIPDVGNPWLDAGIVPFSTLPADWFPANFITESFPGQFKNWFYAMIAMSTVLKKTNPYQTVLGFASLLAEDGRAMHKSWGNAIEFNEGADKIGADVMRWMYVNQNPTDNMLFGYKKADETRRRFHLILWNVYNFFVTYANLDKYQPTELKTPSVTNALDVWILARLKQVSEAVTVGLSAYDAQAAARSMDEFLQDLSLWYVRRSRDRIGLDVTESSDKNDCYATLHYVLVVFCQLLAPFNPFISEEIYKNLTQSESVHLSSWPKLEKVTDGEQDLIDQMQTVRKMAELGLSLRKAENIKIRQPLASISYQLPNLVSEPLLDLLKQELNIKSVTQTTGEELTGQLDTNLTEELRQEGEYRELVRQIQDFRKTQAAKLDQSINVVLPENTIINSRPDLLAKLKQVVIASEISFGPQLSVTLL